MIEIAQRVYRGLPDDPKTERGKRQAALPPDLAGEVDGWRDISPDTGPEALVFPFERGTYLSRDNFLRRNIQKKARQNRARLGELSGATQDTGQSWP